MRRLFKIIIVLTIMMSQISIVYATDPNKRKDGSYTDTGTSIHDNAPKWSDKSTSFWKPSKSGAGEDEITKKANVIVTAIRNIGIILSVIALMVIGIKEMTSSAEEKSIIKQALPGYLLGVIMVVAITMLPTIIYNLTKGLE